MKLSIPKIGVLVTVVSLASIAGIYAISFDHEFTLFEKSNGIPSNAAFMMGNVKVTHFDENGEVIGYRQGTNHITKWGMAIIMGQVFADVNSTFPHQANVSGRVSHMQIGTGGEQGVYANQLAWNNTDIAEPIGDKSAAGYCGRERVISINNNTQGPAHAAPSTCDDLTDPRDRTDCFARHNVTATAQFLGANCEIASIDEAGIYTTEHEWDDGPGEVGLMFARNTFGSVTLGPLDTLQLEWEFTFTDS